MATDIGQTLQDLVDSTPDPVEHFNNDTTAEINGGSRKPQVEHHKQTQVRVTVAPAPFASAVRRMKRETVGAV